MARKKVAWVVFRGRKPGIYVSWEECNAQVHRFSDAKQHGYYTLQEAQQAWQEWEEKRLRDAEDLIASRRPLQPVVRSLQNGIVHTQRTTNPELKRQHPIIGLDTPDDDNPSPPKRHHIIESSIDESPILKALPGIELTEEQEAVVQLALRGHNMFLTGAGGSGKTVTLLEILRRLTARKTKFQVVAPTGIAALPLDGKTIHSFMGWKPETLRSPMVDILKNLKPYTCESIRKAQVLIVEEISMVENQVLERMNLVLQHVMESGAPFGGKQVIFLGDFHQLPPVKPFEFCLQCGGDMSKMDSGDYDLFCGEKSCTSRGRLFKEGDKWAFKAPIWQDLRLRHVQLQRIHRQKDKSFKDILTNIREGTDLTPEEWDILESPKPTPPHDIEPVRLMSKRVQVAEINRAELQAIKEPLHSWPAQDSYSRKKAWPEWNFSQPWKTDLPLKNCRYLPELHLKTGAKVVLLHNLDQKRGLVNGSQGVVVGFLKVNGKECDPSIKRIEGPPVPGPNNTLRYWDTLGAPVVKFANGLTRPIFATDLTSHHGTKALPYIATRVQIPLTLAWALTIHKSQGMTLDFIEVSSEDIFETGQFYVALSRGTNINGVTVTGFSREQLPLDDNVVVFYRDTDWKVFGEAKRDTGTGDLEDLSDDRNHAGTIKTMEESTFPDPGDEIVKVGWYWDPTQPASYMATETSPIFPTNRAPPDTYIEETPHVERDMSEEIQDSAALSSSEPEPDALQISKYWNSPQPAPFKKVKAETDVLAGWTPPNSRTMERRHDKLDIDKEAQKSELFSSRGPKSQPLEISKDFMKIYVGTSFSKR